MKKDIEQNTIQTDVENETHKELYTELNMVQLRSGLVARDREIERKNDAIETFNKVVRKQGNLVLKLKDCNDRNRELKRELKGLEEGPLAGQRELIIKLHADLESRLNTVVENDCIELGDALLAYGNRIAEHATTPGHAEICVTVLQLALRIKHMKWNEAMSWLHSGEIEG